MSFFLPARKNPFSLPIIVLGIAAFALAACTDVATRSTIDNASQTAHDGLKQAAHPDLYQRHYDPLVVSDKIWTGTTAVRMHRGVPLPERLEGARGVALVSATPMSMDEIAKAINAQTGIPVNLADAGAAAGKAATTNGGAANSGAVMAVAYEGPLSGFLERVASTFGISWRFDGASITIKRFETRVFTIEALPGSLTTQEGMQDDQSGGSSGGGSSGGSSSATSTITQNSKTQIDIKYWDEIGQVLNSILGGTGTVVVSSSLGIVTVTTTPELMRAVADYLAQENQKLSRQIAVNVEIYSVNLSEGLDFSIAFSAAIKALSQNVIAGVTAPAEAANFTGAGSMQVAILNSKDVGTNTDTFKALSAIGDTVKVAQFPVITLNNRTVSRRVGQDIGYLASSTTTAGSTTTTGPTVSLSPGTIHQGFSVQLTPRLLDDGRILLQYSLSIVDLVKLSCFSSQGFDCTGTTASSSTLASGSAIQIPTTANRIFIQQSALKSGSTLVIGGAQEDDTVQNSQGVGDPFNYLLGGGVSNSRSHTMIFFAITPQVFDQPTLEPK